jgi:hypothetical protein
MSSIFSAQGGYESAQSFVDGLRPALVTGSAVVALAAVAALAIPARRSAARRAAGDGRTPATAPEAAAGEAPAPATGALESTAR